MNLAQHEIEHDILGINGQAAPLSGVWADRPAPAANAGKRYIATDVADAPIEFQSDGENYRPLGGMAGLFLVPVSNGIAPSGTIGTGAAGHLTLATGFQLTYTEGLWLYLGDTTGAAPAFAAGWYWVVMSSTTVGTIHTSGPESPAYVFTVGGSYTGVTTATKIPFSFTLKGGVMPPKALLEISGLVLQSNAAGAKLGTVFFGGQASLSTSNGSFFRRNVKGQITNKGVSNKQVTSSWVADAGTGASIGTAVDTGADVLIEFELKTPDAAQYVIFDHLRCTLIS